MARRMMRGILSMRHSDRIVFIRRSVRIILLCGVVFSLWLVVRDTLVMKREDGITSMKIFYEQPQNSIDVLFTGSSHACYNIAAEELYDRHGISFYQLWGSSQPFWSTYHFIAEALKTQDPKVVVMDVYGAVLSDEYSDEARQATNTLGLNISRNQIQNILVSSPKERWLELFLGLPIYHDRFSELLEGDFSFYPWSKRYVNVKGGEAVYGSNIVVDLDYEKNDACIPLSEKQETYLRKIISLCRENGTNLVLVVTPTAQREAEQGYYNSVKAIAEETGTVFINMNELDQEIGLESSDFSYDDSHLNLSGARKTAMYLGEYLSAHYDLPDHRNDPAYEGWAEYSRTKKNDYLAKIMGADHYFQEIARQDYSAVIIKSELKDEENDLLDSSMKEAGFSEAQLDDTGNRIYRLEQGKVTALAEADAEFRMYDTEIKVSFSTQTAELGDRIRYQWHKPGYILFVYDPDTGDWIDEVFMPEDSGYYIERIQ